MNLYNNIHEKLRKNIDIKIINMVHIFIVGTVLAFIGFKKNKTPKKVFYLLYVLCLLLVFLVGIPKPKLSYWNVIKIVHYLLILPALLYIAYTKEFSNNTYNIIMATGIGIIGYHSFRLFGRLKKK